MPPTLRSIRLLLPADLTQLILLLGVVCLLVSCRLPWSVSTVALPGGGQNVPFAALSIMFLPVLFASFAGYYFCFWAVRRPIEKICLLVVFPATLRLVATIVFFYRAVSPPHSVLAADPGGLTIWKWAVANAGNFTLGPRVCLLGIVLCLVFLSRMSFGLAKLPLAVVANELSDESLGSWRNCKALIFLLVGPVYLLWILMSIPMLLVPSKFSLDPAQALLPSAILSVLNGLILLLMPVLFLRKPAWNLSKHSVTLPEPRHALLGLLVPVAITFSISAAQFLAARVEWAHQLVRGIPPEFRSFFMWAGLNVQQLIQLIPSAFAEEILFRGVLLVLLTKRYGLHRGVFFTGIIWAAFHFPTDAYPRQSVGDVAAFIAFRIFGCLAMNYVFAWMTIRWKSVIPSGFAHTISNVLIFAGVNPPADFAWPLQIVCWSVVAYVLWRYWPITKYDMPMDEASSPEIPLANPQPAV